MRNRSRLLMLIAPWLAGVGRSVHAQATTNVPGTGSGPREQGEVQVGAGTQGDVTTGSSGTKAKKADGGKKDSGKESDGKSQAKSSAPDRSAARKAGSR